MKKVIGYLVIIVLGVATLYSIACRVESLDNNVSKESNAIELFA